eukprot:7362172-Pyramimonas_sp.AAC.1
MEAFGTRHLRHHHPYAQPFWLSGSCFACEALRAQAGCPDNSFKASWTLRRIPGLFSQASPHPSMTNPQRKRHIP